MSFSPLAADLHVCDCLRRQKLEMMLNTGMLIETSQFADAAGGRGAGVAAADGGDLLQTGAQPQQRAAAAQAQPLEPQVSAAAPAEDEGECQASQPVQYPSAENRRGFLVWAFSPTSRRNNVCVLEDIKMCGLLHSTRRIYITGKPDVAAHDALRFGPEDGHAAAWR